MTKPNLCLLDVYWWKHMQLSNDFGQMERQLMAKRDNVVHFDSTHKWADIFSIVNASVLST
jgi:hypothetical protein